MSINSVVSRAAAITVFTLVLLFPIGFASLIMTGCGQSNTDSPEHPSLKIDRNDEERINEIIQNTMLDPTYLSRSIREEFWTLLQKGDPTEQEVIEYREFVAGVGTTYQRYFWDDARRSLNSGEPVKSEDRKAYEMHLIDIGAMVQSEVERNDDLIKQIASGTPLEMEGQTILVDGRLISQVLSNIDSVIDRVELLFTPL